MATAWEQYLVDLREAWAPLTLEFTPWERDHYAPGPLCRLLDVRGITALQAKVDPVLRIGALGRLQNKTAQEYNRAARLARREDFPAFMSRPVEFPNDCVNVYSVSWIFDALHAIRMEDGVTTKRLELAMDLFHDRVTPDFEALLSAYRLGGNPAAVRVALELVRP